MAPNPRRQDEKLDALYAKLPEMECKGECFHYCRTTMIMSLRERKRIEERHGSVKANALGWCTMLEDKRCKAQPVKPMFCRLWGMTEDMRCPYGCEPKPRFLTPQEGAAFLSRADEIAGTGNHKREMDDRVWLPVSAFVGRT